MLILVSEVLNLLDCHFRHVNVRTRCFLNRHSKPIDNKVDLLGIKNLPLNYRLHIPLTFMSWPNCLFRLFIWTCKFFSKGQSACCRLFYAVYVDAVYLDWLDWVLGGIYVTVRKALGFIGRINVDKLLNILNKDIITLIIAILDVMHELGCELIINLLNLFPNHTTVNTNYA